MISKHLVHKIKNNLFFISIVSIFWLLYRSGGRPSRIIYPCQKAAAGNLSAFLYPAILAFAHKIKHLFYNRYEDRKRFINSRLIGFAVFISIVGIPSISLSSPRVVSTHDSDATDYDYATGYYWEHIDQDVVNNMVDRGVMALTGETNTIDAWNALIPYQSGESVVIKLNFNNAYGCGDDNGMDAHPEPVNAVIDGLLSIGVPPDKIWITDPSRSISTRFSNMINNSNVQFFVVKASQNCRGDYNLTTYVDASSPDASPTTHPAGDVVRPAQVFVDADHLINIPLLKGHGHGHMTLSMKNHYGSVTFSGSNETTERSRMHAYLEQGMNSDPEKSILADINNNPHIRDKTRLVIGDGLFGHPTRNWGSGGPVRWASFNNDDPNILFFGTDFMATDSVMLDYIQEEQTSNVVHSSLHHGALLGLGVHEHWDDFATKQYTTIDYVEIDLDNTNCIPVSSDDANCDGVDDDCDDAIDDDYISDESCFLQGACAGGNVGSSCNNGIETPCYNSLCPSTPEGFQFAPDN